MPNRKSVHVLCCVAVGIVGTDDKGQVHEIEDGNMEAEAISVALLHLKPDQQAFSVSEINSSARQRFTKKVSSCVEETLDKIKAVVGSTNPSCTCKGDRSIFSVLVGDNIYDVSDLKTKIEAKFKSIHMVGGLCGYDTRKQAVYYSSPASRMLEHQDLQFPSASFMDVDEGTKVFSLRKCIEGSNICSAPVPMYQVLRELEHSHGSLHGVTFGVKRKIPVSVDSEDSCIVCDKR